MGAPFLWTVSNARRVELVATPQAGGPRLLLDVVTTDAFDRSHPVQCATQAGYAVEGAARAKVTKYADHPPADAFFPLAIDTHGALGARWLELLHQLARHAVARFHAEPGDFPAAGSLAQVYRMRLAVSLQRSMARALHLRAGRALAAASGSGQGTYFQEHSLSDLRLLSRACRPLLLAVLSLRALAFGDSFPAASLSDLRLLTRTRSLDLNELFQKGRGLCKASQKRVDKVRGCRKALKDIVSNLRFSPILCTSFLERADGHHTRRVDLVASTPGGGARIIADVVTTDVVDRSNLGLSASRAGHAASKAARCKAAKHSDHPPVDEFVPLAVDMHGALGSQWLDLLARLARRAVSRRRGEPADFNAAGSWAQLARLLELAAAVAAALQAAQRYRVNHTALYPSQMQAAGPGRWTSVASVREGLWALASPLANLGRSLAASEPTLLAPLPPRLAVVIELLLSAYDEALKAAEGPGGAAAGSELHAEYCRRREILLADLREVTRAAALAAADDTQWRAALRREYACVVQLARRHCGYATLFAMCDELQDSESLRVFMKDGAGASSGGSGGKDTFCQYVFLRFWEARRYGSLLELGFEFAIELAHFLEDHPTLRFLHQLYLRQYGDAAACLKGVATTGADFANYLKETGSDSGSGAEGEAVLEQLALRRRQLCMAKLAAMAGGIQDAKGLLEQFDAELGLLEVQESLAAAGHATAAPLSSSQLVRACLGAPRELVPLAFTVFCLAGDAFLRGSKELLEAAWSTAARYDDWEHMRALGEVESWGDAQLLDALESTLLFQAAASAYHPAALLMGAPMSVILPLLRQDKRSPAAGSSVEDVVTAAVPGSAAQRLMCMALQLGRGDEIELQAYKPEHPFANALTGYISFLNLDWSGVADFK
eukprot:SM000054S18155  [mRNA]  locus=s54:601470:619581:- [translate_table: standard]